MRQSLVSVIVPTKNSAQFLEACLKSVAGQTYKNIELIVVDNNSTDATKQIAKKYTDRVFNKGPERSAQVNYGVEHARGEYVYKVDSDFVLDPEVIEQCIDEAMAGFDAVVVHNSPDTSVSWIAKIRKFEVDMYKYDIIHSSARFVRKEVYEAIGGFNEKITAGEDYDFQNKLNRAGYKTGFVEAEALHLGEPTSLWKHMRKYYDYGKDFVNYKKNNISESKAQLGFFRSVYIKNWQDFVRHPLLGLGFILYSLAKFSCGGFGYAIASLSHKADVTNYKSIVPNLVSIETRLPRVRGLHISQNFDFYNSTTTKLRFHYKIELDNKIVIPQEYDFRSENFIKKGDRWFYQKKLGLMNLRFLYDTKSRTFAFNRSYSLLPFRLGGVFLAGEHIASFIYLELFLNNFLVMRGSAFCYKGQVYCLSAPGFNGKTNFIIEMLQRGAEYLAEDNLIIDIDSHRVYPSCPFLRNDIWHRRDSNLRLADLLSSNQIIKSPQEISHLFLVQNSLSENYKIKNKSFRDFLLLNSLYFLGDLFTKSIIFEYLWTDQLLEQVNQSYAKLHPKFISINQFNYKEVIQK